SSHTWVIGKTGVGKSTAMVRWAVDDIINGEGIAFFDPHGDGAQDIIKHIPKSRRNDVVYFNPYELAIGFNVFDNVPEERKSFVASSIVDSFKAVWGYTDISTPALDQFLYNGARAMMDMPDGTLLGLKFLLTSAKYRKRVISHIKDPTIADFWKTDFEEHMPEREQRERTLSTLNKIGALISDPAIRTCIGQPKSRLDLKDIMDNGKILIVSLPHGQLGIEKSALIGSLIMSQLHLVALTRNSTRRPFHIYVDECHHFGASTLAEMLSGIRKFGVSLVLGHQYLDQLPQKLKAGLLGTVGTIVSFRIGALDTQYIEPEFHMNNDDYTLCELQPFTAYIRAGLMTTLLSMPQIDQCQYPGNFRRIRNRCRCRYALPRKRIEERIARFIENT
ncbi:MAG: type IV secretory system conjugative DNA transfer family protein, partial [Hyphomicrobiales bacterium]|nr:type IV secretory system conjugative DNA transfer family protein [Hyphomicrobiales bacterium]